MDKDETSTNIKVEILYKCEYVLNKKIKHKINNTDNNVIQQQSYSFQKPSLNELCLVYRVSCIYLLHLTVILFALFSFNDNN